MPIDEHQHEHNNAEFSGKSPDKRRRGIYLLPNLFTTASLFAGFYAIVAAMNGRFESAAVAVYVAMVMDGIDGRLARMTNTQSDFGAEYDSLVDMVSFGLAPALVIYEWALASFGKLGWLAAFLYTASAALRLARFNTQVEQIDKAYFKGLASPSAAAVVTGVVWIGSDYDLHGWGVSLMAMIVTVAVGLLMVSNIRYRSFKNLDLKGRVPFVAVFIVVLIYVFISLHPPLVLLAGFSIYALSGPVWTLFMMRRKRRGEPVVDQSPSGNHDGKDKP